MFVPDIIIAIDGYSSTGKSSFAKLVAAEFGFLYLDSGAMYRGVTLYAMENGLISDNGAIDIPALVEGLNDLDLHFRHEEAGNRLYNRDRCIEKEIRSMAVSARVSPVSAIAAVRSWVDSKLRDLAKDRRVVMDGRDIGTTVFPDAELKIFMTADPMVRARRRALEMEQKGEYVELEDVLANLKERDYIDSHREVSPLSKADDAIVLDNSEMTFDDQMVWIKSIIKQRWESQ